ncbi:hypothetical protein SLA2020_438410 [Shorea laevis]
MASIPVYYMQSTMLPSSILSDLDKISRDFLWGSDPEHRRAHLINWDKVSIPKSLGGLGIKSAKEANLAAMAKLNWRLFSERDKLWNSVMARKYNINSHPSTLPPYGSPVIKSLKKGNKLFLQGIRWNLVDGRSISFWKDCWLLDEPLNSVLFGPWLNNDDDDVRVADVLSIASFDSSRLSYALPETILETIKACPISRMGVGKDSYSWKGSHDGSFP